MWYTYLILCEHNKLYCGTTNDLSNRFKAHIAGRGAKFTKSFKPMMYVWKTSFHTRSEACIRECEVKKMTRVQKEKLISDTKIAIK